MKNMVSALSSHPKRPILLLAAIIIGLLPSACTEPPTPESVTITFACASFDAAYYEELADQFHETNPNVTVRVIPIEEILEMTDGWVWPQDATRRLASAADTVSVGIGPWEALQGVFMDLEPFITADQGFQAEDFYPNALESLQWDGGTWGIPHYVMFDVIFYDQEIFDAEGVPRPEPGWTWDDFAEKATLLTAWEGDEVTRWGFVRGWPGSIPFIAGRVGTLLDRSTDPPTPLLNRPAVIEAVRWYADLHLRHQVMPPYLEPRERQPGEEWIGSEEDVLIETGRAAMWQGSTFWNSNVEDRQLSIAPYPIEKSADATTPIEVWPHVMSAGTVHPQESWRWLAFLSRQPLMRRGAGIPYLPARRSVAEESGYWESVDREMGAALQFALGHGFPIYGIHRIYFPLDSALDAVLKGEKNVEAALASAQSEAELLLEKEHTAATPEPIVVSTPKPEAEGELTITFIPYAFEDVNAYERLAVRFHESHPEIFVQMESPDPAGGPATIVSRAGTGDCFVWYSGADDETLFQHVLSLDPFVVTDLGLDLDDFYPQTLDAFRQQGSLWAIPDDVQVKVMYYNQDLFDAAGVDYPPSAWTTDEFLQTAIALTRGEGEEKQYGFVPLAISEADDMRTFVGLRGASPVDERSTLPQPHFDASDVVEAVRWYVELATVHEVKPLFSEQASFSPETSTWETRLSLIRDGRAAMWTDLGGLHEGFYPQDLRVGTVPLPLDREGRMSDWFVMGYTISKDTPHAQACWEWITYLSAHGLEVVEGLPARRSLAESPEFRAGVGEQTAAAYRFSMAHSAGSPRHYASPWPDRVYYWLYEAHREIVQGSDPPRALAEAQRKAEAYIACLASEENPTSERVQKTCAREADPTYREFGEEE